MVGASRLPTRQSQVCAMTVEGRDPTVMAVGDGPRGHGRVVAITHRAKLLQLPEAMDPVARTTEDT